MKIERYLFAALLLLVSSVVSFAADASPVADGFEVVEEASVFNGEFSGCYPEVGIPMNSKFGKLFICTTYGRSPNLYYPKAVVLKNKKGEFKVLINGTEYQGYFLDDFQKPDVQ